MTDCKVGKPPVGPPALGHKSGVVSNGYLSSRWLRLVH